MLFGQCQSTLSFCYENMSPNTSYYDGKHSPVRNFPVFCKKKKKKKKKKKILYILVVYLTSYLLWFSLKM